ncbi:Mpp10 protein-domain-containing protein [Boletus coccyginus]|nr:Mpp10 protein-domain-containing protein [Boletus coccyginus]
MSTHEQRLAALQTEIQALEASSIAPKEWTLLGEASARARPHDALLGHDLEFDRATRANASRRASTRVDSTTWCGDPEEGTRCQFLPSRAVELQDTKSTQSLAQIYEGAYVAAQSGTSTDDRDGRLRREHDEIARAWEGICAKLDALCNAHYVPKPPKGSITTVSDVPAASLESALPSSRSRASMLAPEEVLAPTSFSDVRARSELTPSEKRARRTKERKTKKKMRDALKQDRGQEAALKSLVKSGKGVTVVGKGGKTQKMGKLAKKDK